VKTDLPKKFEGRALLPVQRAVAGVIASAAFEGAGAGRGSTSGSGLPNLEGSGRASRGYEGREFTSVGERAAQRVQQRNRGMAAVVRKERAERKGVHLRAFGESSAKACCQEELETMSLMLNNRMVELIEDPLARSWYKLFNHMDDDGSGLIDFHELEDMIRNELKVPNSLLNDEGLRCIWLALDNDSSGQISSGEFGHFMQLGGYVHDTGTRWKDRLLKAKKAEAESVRKPLLEKLGERRDRQNADKASRRQRAQKYHDSAWGYSAPDPVKQSSWRSPRAMMTFPLSIRP